jgi:hypothetical protein
VLTDQKDHRRDNGFLRRAAIAFVIGFGIHGLDHLRRGMSASPMFIMVGGSVQALFVAAAVIMAFTHRARAPLAAILVGFGSGLLFTSPGSRGLVRSPRSEPASSSGSSASAQPTAHRASPPRRWQTTR